MPPRYINVPAIGAFSTYFSTDPVIRRVALIVTSIKPTSIAEAVLRDRFPCFDAFGLVATFRTSVLCSTRSIFIGVGVMSCITGAATSSFTSSGSDFLVSNHSFHALCTAVVSSVTFSRLQEKEAVSLLL